MPITKTFTYEDADELAKKFKDCVSNAITEEDLKINIERYLRNFFEGKGLEYTPHHEYTIFKYRK